MNRWTLLALFGLAMIAHAQTLSVRDQETKQPIELVLLTSVSPKALVTTDAHGRADISAFAGAEIITIRCLGYQSVQKSFAELEQNAFELHLAPAPLMRHEIVVSGTRWRQSSTEVPSEIVTVSSEDVAFQNPQTAADLLGISGKVFIQKSQQGGGSPMIRGFATNRLLYTVDGVRMNTAIFRGGNLQNVISLDPFATESTEVFFGPGSVIYGSDAIGGTMAFQTLTPRFTDSDTLMITGTAAARYSSANTENTGHFDVNVGGEKISLVTSFSAFDYDDLVQGSHGPDDYLKPVYVQRRDGEDVVVTQGDPNRQVPSGYSQTNLMQKIRYMPNERWDFQFGFHNSETSSYGRYDRHNRVRNGLPRYGEWDYGPQKWTMNNLNIFHNQENRAFDQMTLRLAQQSFEESRIDRNLNSDERHIRVEDVDAYSINFDLVKSIGGNNTLYYGIEYVRNDVRSTGIDENIATGAQVPGPARYPQADWESMAVYVNDQHIFSPQFLLQTGLRYNRYTLDAEFDTTFYPFPFTTANLDNGALTGSLGGVYRPSDTLVLSANLATAFRSPNVDDVGKVFDSEPGSVVVPNPDLEAEYAYNADLGIAKAFGERVRADLTGYYTKLRHALVRRDFTLNGEEFIEYDGVLSRVQAIQNAADAEVYGVQAGIQLHLPAGFKIVSDFNYQKGEEELDDGTVSPSRHAAPWYGITRLEYDTHKIRLQLYGVFQGERKHEDLAEEERGKDEIYAADAEGNTYSPSWYTLNLKAMYQVSYMLSISAGIENITDQRYRPYSSGISGPGRDFILSANARF